MQGRAHRLRLLALPCSQQFDNALHNRDVPIRRGFVEVHRKAAGIKASAASVGALIGRYGRSCGVIVERGCATDRLLWAIVNDDVVEEIGIGDPSVA